MENENNNSKEIINNNESVTHEKITKNVLNQNNLVKNTSVSELKNLFNLNQNNNRIEPIAFHNSLKLFKKNNLNSSLEPSSQRTYSKERNKIELNKKNFPSKKIVCKGNINNNINIYDPHESSPIVQYFQYFKAGGQDSIENANNLGYVASPASPGFNYSPSLIFNKKKIGSEVMSVKSRKSIEPMFLNNPNEDKNLFENYDNFQNQYEITYNEENEINNEKDNKHFINETEHNQIDNKIDIKEKEENSIEKNDNLNEKNNIELSPIQNAMKKLIRKKSKVSENESTEKKVNNNLANEKINTNSEKNVNKNDKIEEIKEQKTDFENDEMFIKNVLNDLDEGIIYEEKNKDNKNLVEEIGEEKDEQKRNLNNKSNNNDSILDKFKFNSNNDKNNIIQANQINKITKNKYNNIINNNCNPNILNYMNKRNLNNPNLINNYTNNNLNNNSNNSYIQFNYMMYNNPNYNSNPNLNLMMIQNQPHVDNNINKTDNRYIPQNMFNLNINNYNNNYSQRPKNIIPFNNNINLKQYGQVLPNTGNINIQNNYFLYNSNQESNNYKNTKNNKEEKQKKKKKKKIKKLEQDSYLNKPFEYYLENFPTMAKDQGASRYLQSILNNYSPQMINSFYLPLYKNIMQLINDPFANYFIQKIICFFTQEQLLNILNLISSSFYEISCNSHGTRVLQKLIELIKTPELRSLFFELVKPKICQLLKDLNGTYIVQKFSKFFFNEYGCQINTIIIDNSVELCTYRHGCCVIQKYLENRDPYLLPNLVYKLVDGFSSLITDQFGNYVIKTILLIDNQEFSNRIGEKIFENIIYYSKHKYSSNIVEKCFDYCQGIVLINLINSIQQEKNVKELILDEHGNYVVQKVLAISNLKKRKEMFFVIKSILPQLRQTHFGEKIIHRLWSTYPDIYSLYF